MLIVEVSSENDREYAVTRIKEGFSDSYVDEGANMLFPQLTDVGISLDMPEDEIISPTCEKDDQFNHLVESGKTLEVVKCWDIKPALATSDTKKLLLNVHRICAHTL